MRLGQISLIFTAIFFLMHFFAEDETTARLMRCILTPCCKGQRSRDRSRSHATSNIDPLLWDLISSWICPAQHEYCGVPSDVEMSPTAFGRRSIMNVVICYWCNWFICPITLETVVSPFFTGPLDTAAIRQRRHRPQEQWAHSARGGALCRPTGCLRPSGRGEAKNTPKCQNLETIFSIKWIYVYIFLYHPNHICHIIYDNAVFFVLISSCGYLAGCLIYSATESTKQDKK